MATAKKDPTPTPAPAETDAAALPATKPEASAALPTAATMYDDLDALDPTQSEVSAEDVAVPRIKILQDLSPETKKTKLEWIPDAKPGMFLNSATERLWSGELGIFLIPCAFMVSYTEWKPRGGGGGGSGFVGDRTEDSGIDELWRQCYAKRGENANRRTLLPNGNELNRSADHYVLFKGTAPNEPWQEAVLGLSGSQAKKSRRWLAVIQSKLLTRSNGVPFRPLPCAFTYLAQTREESNDDGTWYGIKIVDAPPAGEVMALDNGRFIYERAKSFRNLVLEGKRRAAVEMPLDDDQRGAGGPGDDDLPF